MHLSEGGMLEVSVRASTQQLKDVVIYYNPFDCLVAEDVLPCLLGSLVQVFDVSRIPQSGTIGPGRGGVRSTYA